MFDIFSFFCSATKQVDFVFFLSCFFSIFSKKITLVIKYFINFFTILRGKYQKVSQKNQGKGARQLEDLMQSPGCSDFIKEKLEGYKEEKRQKNEVIKSSHGQVSIFSNFLENF